MDRTMRTALHALAARRAPDYRGNIMEKLVSKFGEAKCALYEVEIAEYLQCLRNVHPRTELRLGAERHHSAVQYICRAANNDTEFTYTAFREAFRERFGADVFEAFKPRIVALLRCVDALTTKRYFGRLLVRVRAVNRSDGRSEHRGLFRFCHGVQELDVLEKKVPALSVCSSTSAQTPSGSNAGGTSFLASSPFNSDRLAAPATTEGVFLAFDASRCNEDGHLIVRLFPKCRKVFHMGFTCSCVAEPDCELVIPLGKVYGTGNAADAWHDVGESDGSRVAIRLQFLFHESSKQVPPQYLSDSPFKSERGDREAETQSSASSSPSFWLEKVRRAKGSKPHRASNWLQMELDAALQRLYASHKPETTLQATRFQIDAGEAASQMQRNRRVSTAIHMSSLLSIKERQQVVRWSTYGGLEKVPASVGQARRWLQASDQHGELVWGGVPRAMRPQLYLKVSGMARIMKGHEPGYYARLVSNLEVAPDSFSVVIERDIPRTFGGMDLQGRSIDEVMATLRRILLAYACRNQVLGYCQSMNFIVAFFLLHLNAPEEQAFWLLVACVERLAPDYYLSTMEGLRAEFEILRLASATRFPRLLVHMEAMQASFESMVTGSLLCFFVTSVPMETAARLMDVAFFAGTDAYLATLCAILRLSSDALMEQTNIVSFSGLLKLAQVQQIDSEAFIEAVRNEFYLEAGDLCAEDDAGVSTASPSSSASAATTAILQPIEFFSDSADIVRCQESHALSCNTDAQRLRSVRHCLDAMFPQDRLSSFTQQQYSNLMMQLQQPCFLFFNVVSACRLAQTGGNIARHWRRAPRPLAIREWPVVARRAPAGAYVASRIPTCPMYTQYVALYTVDYWCIPAGGSEWTRLLRNSPALVSSGARALTDSQLFDAFDFNADGVINVHELVLGMALLDPSTCLPRLNPDGARDIAVADRFCSTTIRQKLELLFTVFDSKAQGCITGIQFRALARYLEKLLRCRFNWDALGKAHPPFTDDESDAGRASALKATEHFSDAAMQQWFALALPVAFSSAPVIPADQESETYAKGASHELWSSRLLSLDDVHRCLSHRAPLLVALRDVSLRSARPL